MLENNVGSLEGVSLLISNVQDNRSEVDFNKSGDNSAKPLQGQNMIGSNMRFQHSQNKLRNNDSESVKGSVINPCEKSEKKLFQTAGIYLKNSQNILRNNDSKSDKGPVINP